MDILDRRTGTTDIALVDLTRGGKPSFVTTDPIADFTPVLSPDGRQLAFASSRAGAPNVHVKNLNSADDAVPIVKPSGTARFVSDWAQGPEGAFIIYQEWTPTTGIDLMLVPLWGDRALRPLVNTPFNDTDGGCLPTASGWRMFRPNPAGTKSMYVR